MTWRFWSSVIQNGWLWKYFCQLSEITFSLNTCLLLTEVLKTLLWNYDTLFIKLFFIIWVIVKQQLSKDYSILGIWSLRNIKGHLVWVVFITVKA